MRLSTAPSGRLRTALAAAILLLAGTPTPPAAAADGGWQQIETRHCVLRYRNLGDLVAFNRRVRYLPEGMGVERMMAPRDFGGLQEVLGRKLDALFRRAQEILDMRRRVEPVTIELHPDRKALAAAYERLFGAPCNLRAWYLFETRTVYLNVDDVHEGILAHEMGHHIIDHFFEVRPPAATAEILARYIDAHLFR